MLLPKDYIRYHLTGEYALDKVDGSGTLLFDLRKRTWSPEILDMLGINPTWMPPTFGGAEISGSIQPVPNQVEAYRKAYSIYQELYPALKPSFEKISN